MAQPPPEEPNEPSQKGATPEPPHRSSKLSLVLGTCFVAAVLAVGLRPRFGSDRPSQGTNATDSIASPSKRGIALAAVIDRDGLSDRLRLKEKVVAKTGDRLRSEVTLDDDRDVVVGFLGQNGVWTQLSLSERLPKGTHVSPNAITFDGDPSAGILVAGAPDAIEHARETDDFSAVTMLQVAFEPGVADGGR